MACHMTARLETIFSVREVSMSSPALTPNDGKEGAGPTRLTVTKGCAPKGTVVYAVSRRGRYLVIRGRRRGVLRQRYGLNNCISRKSISYPRRNVKTPITGHFLIIHGPSPT
jgi:hypothetical protein